MDDYHEAHLIRILEKRRRRGVLGIFDDIPNPQNPEFAEPPPQRPRAPSSTAATQTIRPSIEATTSPLLFSNGMQTSAPRRDVRPASNAPTQAGVEGGARRAPPPPSSPSAPSWRDGVTADRSRTSPRRLNGSAASPRDADRGAAYEPIRPPHASLEYKSPSFIPSITYGPHFTRSRGSTPSPRRSPPHPQANGRAGREDMWRSPRSPSTGRAAPALRLLRSPRRDTLATPPRTSPWQASASRRPSVRSGRDGDEFSTTRPLTRWRSSPVAASRLGPLHRCSPRDWTRPDRYADPVRSVSLYDDPRGGAERGGRRGLAHADEDEDQSQHRHHHHHQQRSQRHHHRGRADAGHSVKDKKREKHPKSRDRKSRSKSRHGSGSTRRPKSTETHRKQHSSKEKRSLSRGRTGDRKSRPREGDVDPRLALMPLDSVGIGRSTMDDDGLGGRARRGSAFSPSSRGAAPSSSSSSSSSRSSSSYASSPSHSAAADTRRQKRRQAKDRKSKRDRGGASRHGPTPKRKQPQLLPFPKNPRPAGGGGKPAGSVIPVAAATAAASYSNVFSPRTAGPLSATRTNVSQSQHVNPNDQVGIPDVRSTMDLKTSAQVLHVGDWFYKWNRSGTKVYPRWVWVDLQSYLLVWSHRETRDPTFSGSFKLETICQIMPSELVQADEEGLPKTYYVLMIETTTRVLQLATERRKKVDVWFEALNNVVAFVRRRDINKGTQIPD